MSIQSVMSLQEREQNTKVRRGIEDGLSDLPRSSDAAEYGMGYLRGTLLRRASNREIVLSFMYASMCPNCRFVALSEDPGQAPKECGCNDDAPPALVAGVIGAIGEIEDGDPLEFIPNSALRAYCARGIDVLNERGECLNSMILIQ